MDIFSKVKEILGAQVNRKKFDPEKIQEDTNLEDLGLDSLDVAEVVINLEQEFSLDEVSQEDMLKLKQVKDIEDLIKNYQKLK